MSDLALWAGLGSMAFTLAVAIVLARLDTEPTAEDARDRVIPPLS